MEDSVQGDNNATPPVPAEDPPSETSSHVNNSEENIAKTNTDN